MRSLCRRDCDSIRHRCCLTCRFNLLKRFGTALLIKNSLFLFQPFLVILALSLFQYLRRRLSLLNLGPGLAFFGDFLIELDHFDEFILFAEVWIVLLALLSLMIQFALPGQYLRIGLWLFCTRPFFEGRRGGDSGSGGGSDNIVHRVTAGLLC